MITCDVYGHDPTSNNGLGNQMFCIAASIGLANRLQTQAFFPAWYV